MSALDDLKNVEEKYSIALALFKSFEGCVTDATHDEPLRGAKIVNVPGLDNAFDIVVAGRWFRLACSLQKWDAPYGLITCYALDPFTRKVTDRISDVRFTKEGMAEADALHETMQTPDGAANIVAALVVPRLQAPGT